jgi:hypothetical protein
MLVVGKEVMKVGLEGERGVATIANTVPYTSG